MYVFEKGSFLMKKHNIKKKGYLLLSVLVTLMLMCSCGNNNSAGDNNTPGIENVDIQNPDSSESHLDNTDVTDLNSSDSANIDSESNKSENESSNDDLSSGADIEDVASDNPDNTSQKDDKKNDAEANHVKEENTTADEGNNDSSNNESSKPNSDVKSHLYSDRGAVHVEGTTLVDSKGIPVIMRGVSTHGMAWFPEFVNADAFKTVRDDWGVNCIRLAMYTAEYNGYCTGDSNNKKTLRNLINTSVKQCKNLGMYVIVDWHILSDNNPLTNQDEAIKFFDEMSRSFASYDNVLYEICNEPNGGTSWEDIKKYAEKVIPVIRANSPNAVIIVGTPTWSQEVDVAAKSPIKGYDNLMYTLHFYANTHKDDLRKKLEKAVNAGLPLFVTEFGICDASGAGSINKTEANKWMKLLVKYNIGSCIWNLSNKDETCALIKASCKKTSGWKVDDLTESGKWFVEWMMQNGGAVGPGVSAGNSSSETETEGNESNTSEDYYASGTASNGKLEAEMDLVNSWEADGKIYYQCDVKITNTGSSTVKGWKITVDIGQSFVVSQSWCCQKSIAGTKLTITPESYNSDIESGSTRKDIGIIFSVENEVSSLAVKID